MAFVSLLSADFGIFSFLVRALCRKRCDLARWLLLSAALLSIGTAGRGAAQSLPDLTGTYIADDGGVYYVQQNGNTLSWAGMSVDSGLSTDKVWHRGLGFTNVFRGTVNADNTITGDWADVTRGTILSGGALALLIGSSNGLTQLTKVQATGGFGATTWTQSDPLDDTKYAGSTLDIESRFYFTDKNDGSTLLNPNLKPYRDATVVYGRLTNSHIEYLDSNLPVESEIPHINYDPPFSPPIPHYPDFGGIDRTYSEFFVADAGDADFDLRLKVDMDRLEPDFYTTGWGGRTYGPEVYNLKLNDSSTHQKLNFAGSEAYLGLETIMFGRNKASGAILLPGWSEMDGNSVLINGRPMNGPVLSSTPPPYCDFVQPCPNLAGETPDQLLDNYLVAPAGIALGNLMLSGYGNGLLGSNFVAGPGDGTYVRVTGTLILDCGHGWPFYDCYDNGDDNPDDDSTNVSTHQNQEIHPVYSMDVINYPYRPEDINVDARPNLTGSWGGSDGSTYYVRQIGNTIWWLGMMRDRQPMQPGTNFPIIGTYQLAAAFNAGDPPCSSNQCWAFANVFKGTITESPTQTVIEGDWMGVPQSTAAGSSGGHMKFFVYNHKIIIAATSPSIFPVTIEKMYNPEDTIAPQSTLTIGIPQYVANNQLFVTGAASFTVTATDLDSGMQNIWYRDFLQATAAPSYTPVVGSSAIFTLTGADGPYEVDTYATDNAGNDEGSHSAVAYLDNTPPVAAINQPAATQYGHGDSIRLDYSESDGTGSGVKSFTPKIDGLTELQFGGSLQTGQTIYLYSMSLGSHTFSVDSVDNLGNVGTKSVTFFISVTPESLKQDVNNFAALGCIDNVSQSLIAKLNATENLVAKGQLQAAVNTLAAFIDEVQIQVGRHISTTCKDPNGKPFNPAQVLIGDAQYLQGILASQLKANPLLGSVITFNHAGISGVTVKLVNATKTVVATAITDGMGFYYFAATNGLKLGAHYTVSVTLPKGYKSSTPGSQTFTWQANQVALSNFVLE